MKIHRRAFIEMAGASALSLGVPAASLKASPQQQAEANLSPAALVELIKFPYFYGREYFVLRSGRAKVVLQMDRADLGPAFTWIYFDAQNAMQSGKKARAFNFDPETGFAVSALQVELGEFFFTAYGEQTEWRWVTSDGIPTVEVVWWAGGVRVRERVVALAEAGAFSRTIRLEGEGLAGEELVNLTLALPHGQFRSSGTVLAQIGEKYGCGIAVPGLTSVRADDEKGIIGIGPLTVSPQARVSVQVLHFFQIPDQGMDALLAQGSSLGAQFRQERRKTRSIWATTSTLESPDKTLVEIYDKARFGLPGMIADDGTMNAGILEYGRQWVRDTSNSALGALHAGHFELARAALNWVLTNLINNEGATAIASQYVQPDHEELDQMGELLHALKSYRDWTGDDSLVRENRKKLVALIERPLQPLFRDETGMVHNRREFWERAFLDAYELSYQTYLVLGLRDAADLAPALGAEDQADRWRKEADRTLQSMLSHPTRALVVDGHFIKRRNVTGDVADVAPTGHGSTPDVPFRSEKHNRLYPDATMALPIALGLVDPRSHLALKTLEEVEALWNMRWFGGGHERYNSSSEQDAPGPWPFASCFILRALHEAGLHESSRRVLEWLNSVQGGRTGFWFEGLPLLRSTAKALCGLIPWTSGEIALFTVRHVLGVRFEGARVVIRPALYPGNGFAGADLRFRQGRLRLKIEGSGKIKRADLDGNELEYRPDGSIILPKEFASGTVKIRTS
jgi:hypothetical protein